MHRDAEPDAASGPPLDDACRAIVDCALYQDGARRPGRVPLAEAGDLARKGDGFVWIGIRNPSAHDIAAVAAEFELPALAVEDAVKAHQRPKLEVYDNVLFLVIKPVHYVDYSELAISEIAVFVGSGFVVTVRHGETDVLTRVRSRADHSDQMFRHGAISMLYHVLDEVVDQYELGVETLGNDVDDIEAQVFGLDESNHAEPIYQLKRDVAQIRRSIAPLAGPLHRLAERQVPGVPEGEAAHYFRDVYDHLLRATESLEAHDRMLSDVLQADLARVGVRQADISLRQNEDMRKISAWAAIGLLPTAVAGVYGMNFDHMPELRWRYSYYIVLLCILGACLALYRQFRKRGWL